MEQFKDAEMKNKKIWWWQNYIVAILFFLSVFNDFLSLKMTS